RSGGNCAKINVGLARGDFGLEAQEVAWFHADILETLRVEQLLAAGSMLKLVAEGLAIGGEFGELHPLKEHGEDAIDRDVVGHLDFLTFVSGGVPHLYGDHRHRRSLRNAALCANVRCSQ